jgi:uncharacterized protein YcgI (DUF1989 family)
MNETLLEETVPGGGHASLIVKRGQLLRITDPRGGANVAMLLFNAAEKSERLNLPDTLVVLTAIQHPLDPNPEYAPKPVKLTLRAADPQVAEICRTSCDENARGFINTERFFL